MRTFAGLLCPLAAFVLLAPASVDVVEACGTPVLADDETSRERLRAWLDVWWGESHRERRRAIRESWLELEYLARILRDPQHEMRPFLEGAVTDLVRTERDDFVVASILDRLLRVESPWAHALFRDALSHDSPNVRHRAVQWFALHEDPDPELRAALEDLWRTESAPWTRADLIGALACQGSTRYLDDFLRIARSDDPGFAPIAVRALRAFDDWRIVPLLKSLLRNGTDDIRAGAVTTLAAMPESEGARESVVRFLRESSSELQAAAIREASARPGGGTPLLLEMARSAVSVDSRAAAVSLLWLRDHPDVTGVLRGIVESSDDEGTHELRQRAQSLLATREGMELDGRMPRVDADGCGFDIHRSDPNEDGAFQVRPEPGLTSVRCWSSPGIAGPPEDHPRIPEHETVFALDVYAGTELWVQAYSPGALCWVPRSSLETATGDGDEDVAPDENGRIRIELDLRSESLGAARIVELRRSGAAEVIDPAGEVVGLALEVDLNDPEDLRRLLGHTGEIDEAFDRMIAGAAWIAQEHFEEDSRVAPLLDAYFEELDEEPRSWR